MNIFALFAKSSSLRGLTDSLKDDGAT